MEIGFEWISHYGYGALFVLLMLGIVGLPVPDETVLTFVGYLCFKGELHVVPALATAFLGSASGITLSYILGRVVGPQVVVKWGPYVHLDPDHLAKTQRWITRWGKYTLLIAYFIPGVRHLAALLVGASLLLLPGCLRRLPIPERCSGLPPLLGLAISREKSGNGYPPSCIRP